MTDREMCEEVTTTAAHLAALIYRQIAEGNDRAVRATCMTIFHAMALAGINIVGAVTLFKETEADRDIELNAVEVYPENIKEVLS